MSSLLFQFNNRPKPRPVSAEPPSRKGFTTPPGLASYIAAEPEPVVEAQAEPKPRKKRGGSQPKPAPPCGEYKAYTRHRRLGEPVDDACAAAGNAYSRVHKSLVRRRNKERARLLSVGVSPEQADVLVRSIV